MPDTKEKILSIGALINTIKENSFSALVKISYLKNIAYLIFIDGEPSQASLNGKICSKNEIKEIIYWDQRFDPDVPVPEIEISIIDKISEFEQKYEKIISKINSYGSIKIKNEVNLKFNSFCKKLSEKDKSSVSLIYDHHEKSVISSCFENYPSSKDLMDTFSVFTLGIISAFSEQEEKFEELYFVLNNLFYSARLINQRYLMIYLAELQSTALILKAIDQNTDLLKSLSEL